MVIILSIVRESPVGTNNIHCKELQDEFGFNKKVINIIKEAEKAITAEFKSIDELSEYNQYKVIKCMQECKDK